MMVFVSRPSHAAGTGAGIIFNPSLFYFVDKEEHGTTTESTYQIINFKLGYLTTDGLYLGFNYDMDDRDMNSTSYHRKSYGATVGYISTSGWQILGTYFLKSKYDAGGTNYDGKGFSVDLGYVFNVGSFGLGPLLSYRSWTYDKQNGIAATPELKQSNIVPSIQLFFSF